MTGFIIADPADPTDPAGQETFRDIFNGTDIRAQWVRSPAELAGVECDFVLDLSGGAGIAGGVAARIGGGPAGTPGTDGATPIAAALAQCNAPLILTDAVTPTLADLGADPRLVRINGWNTFLQRPLAEVVAPEVCLPLLDEFFKAWKKSFVLLPDVPGMPSARIVSMIVNEAYFALGEGVSTIESIDTAMKLGTNYPFGPFEWCDLIGPGRILRLLERLAEDNPRYAIAPLLRDEAKTALCPYY